MQRLNELLDKKDLALQDKIREAEAGTRKYGALSQHLATEIRHSAPAQEAKALLEEGKLDEAGAILFAEAYNRANHDRANENHAQAVASYQRALQIKPDHFGTYYNLADSYRKMGDHEQALRAFEQALEI